MISILCFLFSCPYPTVVYIPDLVCPYPYEFPTTTGEAREPKLYEQKILNSQADLVCFKPSAQIRAYGAKVVFELLN
jgi:hypothetical protein